MCPSHPSQDLITLKGDAIRTLIVNDTRVMTVATAQPARNIPIVPDVGDFSQLISKHAGLGYGW